MLVLSRKLQQEILIGNDIKVTVLKVKGNTVRLGIEAPRSVRVVRGELPPIEEKMADVTIVFDSKDAEERTGESSEIVPFRTHDRRVSDPGQKNRSRMNPENPAGPASISFKNRLPSSLNHNRLQQIVTELANKDL